MRYAEETTSDRPKCVLLSSNLYFYLLLIFFFLSKPQRRPLWTITFSSNIHFVKMASQRSESVDGREPTGYTDRKR